MALPTNSNQQWPPKAVKDIYAQYAEHDAWYSGDPNRLASFYAGMLPYNNDFFQKGEPTYYTASSKGRFWAKQLYEERRTMVHIPIAGNLAGTSADLLFSESPEIRIPEAQNGEQEGLLTQQRLEEIITYSDMHNKLLEAAETCAALGGVFLKPNWDIEIANWPILSVAQVDNAVPVFVYGMLKEVTFWKEIGREETRTGDIVWRLLEHHEKGKISYGLYKGGDDMLGMRVALTARSETANLPDELPTGIDDILVRYIPNIRPNRKFRGSSYGQSDFAGLEGLMDSLDEVYSSWMRDIRLGQGRILVPESFLYKNTDGTFSFDVDKEVYSVLDIDPLNAKEVGITVQQFDIRTQQHHDTCLDIITRIVSSAGYSPQTFGLSITGQSESGTALNLRERKSFITKSKKERFWKVALEDILYMMLLIDRIHLGGNITPMRPVVEFQDSLSNDSTQVATAVEMLSRAQAVSVETKVRMLHTDWTNEQIESEVFRIKEEYGISVPGITLGDVENIDQLP